MALRKDEVYSCPNPECAAEIRVTRGAKPNCQQTKTPRCCCGSEMMLEPVAASA